MKIQIFVKFDSTAAKKFEYFPYIFRKDSEKYWWIFPKKKIRWKLNEFDALWYRLYLEFIQN